MLDVIVLGCGISGMAVAKRLNSDRNSICLIDEYEHPGGNHISKDIGPYTFDIGSIFFRPKSSFTKVFGECLHEAERLRYTVERITPSGLVHKHPFDVKRELLSRSPAYVALFALQILGQRMFGKRRISAEAYAKYYLGSRLFADSGLGLFMERFYGLPLSEISYELAAKRMSWIEREGSLRRRTLKLFKSLRPRQKEPTASHLWYARPRAGFPVMYKNAQALLERAGVEVRLGAKLIRVHSERTGFAIETGSGTIRARRLVSTIPVPVMVKLTGVPVETGPQAIALRTLCLRFRGRRGFDAVVLYNFHADGHWKRLTMHSDYYGKEDGWEFFGVEVPITSQFDNLEKALADFRATTAALGLFDGDLELLGEIVTENAYPIYDREAKEKRDSALALLHELGIETVGRQGNFTYIPAADKAINMADQYLASAGTFHRRSSIT